MSSLSLKEKLGMRLIRDSVVMHRLHMIPRPGLQIITIYRQFKAPLGADIRLLGVLFRQPYTVSSLGSARGKNTLTKRIV